MRDRDFAARATDYLGRHLPGTRNLSANTIASYRDAFKLLVIYFRDAVGIAPENLSMADLDRDALEGWLAWLQERGCGDSTLNQRLCAMKAFVRYVMPDDPGRMLQYQRILDMRQRKCASKPMVLPGREGLAAMLRQPDRSTQRGRRDLVLLSVMYDSGARVSEVCGISVRDVRLEPPATIVLHGKGRKARTVPLMAPTAQLLSEYMDERGFARMAACLDEPLFPNSHGRPLSRMAVSDMVARYAQMAREAGFDVPAGVTPHSLRHQKAVDLLEAGVNLVYIRDILGHRSVTTTEIYATVSSERKRAALEKGAEGSATAGVVYPDWTDDGDLMGWLKRLCG